MKIALLLKTALAAIVILATPSSQAAFSYTSGDLYMGFTQVGNTTSDFLVNIGAGSSYRDALTPITLTISGLNQQLKNIFGNDWGTANPANGAVFWGIIGTTGNTPSAGDAARLIYSSKLKGSDLPIASGGQSSVTNTILGVQNYYRGAGNPTLTESTLVNNGAVGSPGGGSGFSFTQQANENFQSNNLAEVSANFANTAGLDLFRVPQTISQIQNVTLEGTFTLNYLTDTLTFTPVPEPSTYVLAGFALVGLCLVVRKRQKAAALLS